MHGDCASVRAEIARNALISPSTFEDAAAPLRLLVDGLDASEQLSLQAILDVLCSKMPRAWEVVHGNDADLYLYTRNARRSGVRAGLSALLLRDDETQPPSESLWMPVPLRVMAVLDLLQDAHDRLALAPAEAVPSDAVTTDAPAMTNDEKCLAFSLSRILARAIEHSLRVRILGFGTLYVCPARAVYLADFEPGRMREVLEAKRFVLTAIAPSSIELSESDKTAHPIEELMWMIGLMTPRGAARQDTRLRLRRWPDFANLPHDPKHLQACAALATAPMDFSEIAAITGLSDTHTDRFLHACELCGLLETVPDAEPARPRQQAAATSSIGGLFDRLWRRLVK